MKSIGILILGAGPTGLGAAWRLAEIAFDDWLLLEASPQPGGLAASFVDEFGFTWDVGGHVQFSHYEYFDRVLDELLAPKEWLRHERESWVWMRGQFIPYPLQNNIHRLPADELERCLAGLAGVNDTQERHGVRSLQVAQANFRDWILATFGRGLAEAFMFPYNFKVWAHPLEMLSAGWVGERVATPDIGRILQNRAEGTDDVSWGPNRTFRFPASGGTGAVWRACAKRLPEERLCFNTAAAAIDFDRRVVTTALGTAYTYETLISTIPLDELIRVSAQTQFAASAETALMYASSNIFGAALRGSPPEHLRKKCWIYYPEDDCPFYRVTVFSNYSPNNVPNNGKHWSLMAEVSESRYKRVDQSRLLDEVTAGLLATGLVTRREDIISIWRYRARYGYPIPGLHRDASLAAIIPHFEAKGVYSRGRFGLWKYEVSNQDHSFMQGVEVVERLLNGRQEITVVDADVANSRKHPWPFTQWKAG